MTRKVLVSVYLLYNAMMESDLRGSVNERDLFKVDYDR